VPRCCGVSMKQHAADCMWEEIEKEIKPTIVLLCGNYSLVHRPHVHLHSGISGHFKMQHDIYYLN